MVKKKLNDDLDMMRNAAMGRTQEWSSIFRDGLDYVYNNGLSSRAVKKNDPRIQVNQLLPAMKQALAVISQRRTDITVRPQEPFDQSAADRWQKVLTWQYKNVLDMNTRLIEASLDGLIFGYYIGKTTWDDKWVWDKARSQWIEQPRVAVIHPRFFGADPEAETIETANYIVSERQIPVAEAIRQWPKFKDQILKAAETEAQPFDSKLAGNQFTKNWGNDTLGHNQKDPGTSEGIEGRLVSLIEKRLDFDPDISTNNQMAGYVVVQEIFWRDYTETKKSIVETVAKAPELNGGGLAQAQEKIRRTYDEPTYPFGRYVVRIKAGNETIILNDSDDKQIWPYTLWPYAVERTMPLPHTWQGMNIVEGARGLQDWMNLNANAMAAHTQLYAHPALIVDESGLEGNGKVADRLQSGPGAIWKVKSGRRDAVEVMNPPQLSQSTFQFHAILGDLIKDTTGIQDIMLGKSPGGRATAVEVQQLQINSQLSTSLTSILRDKWDIALMRRALELNQANMSPGQVIDITGENEQVTISKHMLSHFYDIDLDLTTALPFDRAIQQEKWMTLYQMLSPAYGPSFMLEPLLKSFEIPDADKWLKEAQKLEQQQAQQAKQQQSQAPAGAATK